MFSFILPARNEAAFIADTIAAVQATGYAYEIIVVDNASTDATAELARAAGAQVVHEARQTPGAARNAGAAQASGDWLVFVDADTRPTRELFAAMDAALRTGRYVAGSCLLASETGPKLGLHLWNQLALRRKRFSGAFLFIRATEFHALGGFNPNLVRGEDSDLGQRLPPDQIVILASPSLMLRRRTSQCA